MIEKAFEGAVAQIVALWLPILAGVGIVWLLAHISHGKLSLLLKHIIGEADSFTRRKRNTLSANFLGGLVVAALILFYVVDAFALHWFQAIENKSPEGPAVPILSFAVLLCVFFVGCPIATKYFEP